MSFVLVAGIVLWGAVALLQFARRQSDQRLSSLTARAGYPAGPAKVKHDGVYFTVYAFSDPWSDKTNHYVLMSEVTVIGENDYRHDRRRRFFELPFSLEFPAYYRFARTGTNLSFDLIPPPTRP